MIRGHFTHEANGRLARHLLRNEQNLFRFLDHPDLEATNRPADHAIRPAVVNRKSAGGNRSAQGAETQAILMSLFRTVHQKDLNPASLLTGILRAPTPAPEPLLLGSSPGAVNRYSHLSREASCPGSQSRAGLDSRMLESSAEAR